MKHGSPRRAVFLGSKGFGLASLCILHDLSPETVCAAISLPDDGDGRSVRPEFERECASRNLVLHLARSKSHTHELLEQLAPDVVLVNGWYWLFDPETLALAPHGFIGIHNSLLPRYRGAAPLVWAVINGEEEVGSSLFYMTSETDAGDILGQARVLVETDDTIASLTKKLSGKVLELLPSVWRKVLAGEIEAVPQDHAQATYCAPRTPEDGRICWDWPAERVYNFVRAQVPPYPGAFTLYEGRRLHLCAARLFEAPFHGRPGQVVRVGADHVVVTCGEGGALVIEQVSLEDEVVSAPDILNSSRIRLV